MASDAVDSSVSPSTGSHKPSSGKKDAATNSDKPKLSEPSRVELAMYAAIVTAVLAYFGYDFYKAYGAEPAKVLPYSKLRRGWIRKYRDSLDDAVYDIMLDYWPFITLISCGYLVVSRATLRFTSDTCHHLLCALYTIGVTYLLLGWRVVALMITIHALTVTAARLSLLCVWIVVLAAMMTQNYLRGQFDRMLRLSEFEVSLIYPSMGYLYCRLVSMGHSISRGGDRNLALGLHYVFYLPYHNVGPIITFDNFCAQVKSEGRKLTPDRLASQAWSCFRLLLWLLILELIVHLLPVNAFLSSFNSDVAYSQLLFAMYTHGQSFMLLYLQLFGWGTLVAGLDGIQLPDWPACISRVYTYSEMWRVFDRGLFAVMHSHIYIPLGGSRGGPVRQTLAVLASFAFVSIYHGDTNSIRLWVLLNVVQVLIERLLISVYWRWLHEIMAKFLHPVLHSRLVVFFVSWNLVVSCCIIFFFFFEKKASLISTVLLWEPWTFRKPIGSLLAFAGMAYCYTQLGMAYKRRERQLKLKRQ